MHNKNSEEQKTNVDITYKISSQVFWSWRNNTKELK